MRKYDSETRDWIIDASDERAARAGMVMDLEAAANVIDWIEAHCCIYEGDRAGQQFLMLDWQKAFVTRLFGWRMWSDEWGGWIRRFRRASLWAAKKNGKSPFLAAIGLYLLIGDGEPGQKVYMAAKNGDQARIAQLHAFKMVELSPLLASQCKLFRNTLEIQHRDSNSRQIVLTGDDSRGQKSKEGLNGSVLFDEMHVVDRGLYERVARAGISRRQPIELSVSTAGDEPNSIGKERFDYGRQVASGEREDLRFLHVEYCAPDKVTEAEAASNLERYGRMANPSWGVIVKPSEFAADFESSKGVPRSMARFFQHRLNVWIGSVTPWLDVGAWDECGINMDASLLAGRDCYLGLDLARKLDMAAAVFAFPWPELGDDGVLFWPMFWLPEKTARSRDILFPLMTWANEGYLRLTRDETLDYDVIKRDIREFASKVKVLNIYYDEHYANELTQQLVEGETDGDGRLLVPGMNCNRTVFRQDIRYLTGPCVELERRLKRRMIRHPRNKVFDWQIGHVQVATDRNQNIRPVKPERLSGKSIDGVMAAIMALYGVYADHHDTPRVHWT